MTIDVQAEYNKMLERFYESILLYLQERRQELSHPHPNYRNDAWQILSGMIRNGLRTLNHAEYRDPAFFNMMGNIARTAESLVSDDMDKGAPQAFLDVETRVKRMNLDRIVSG